MANPIIPYAGRVALLDLVISAIQNGGRQSKCLLWTAPFPPSDNTVLTDFVGLTADGLTGQALPVATFAGVNVSGRAIWTFATLNYTSTGPGLPTIAYGYWVQCSDPVTNQQALLWFQQFDTPFVWRNPGDNLPVNLSLSLSQC